MGFLITKIVWWLAAAGLIGFSAGWLWIRRRERQRSNELEGVWTQKIQRSNRELDAMRSDLKTEAVRAQTAIDGENAAKAKVISLQTEISETDGKTGELRSALDSSREDARAIEEKWKAEVGSLAERVSAAETEAKSKGESVAALEAALAAVRRNLAESESAAAQLRESAAEAAPLKAQLEAVQAALRKSEEQAARGMAERDRKIATLEPLAAQIPGRDRKIKELEVRHQGMLREKDGALARMMAQVGELEPLAGRLAELDATSRKSAAVKDGEIAALKAAAQDIESKAAEGAAAQAERLAAVEKSLRETSAGASAKGEQILALQTKVETLQSENSGVIGELQAAVARAKEIDPLLARVKELEPLVARVKELQPQAARAKEIDPLLARVKELEPLVARVKELEPQAARAKEVDPLLARVKELEPLVARVKEIEPLVARAEELDPLRTQLAAANAEAESVRKAQQASSERLKAVEGHLEKLQATLQLSESNAAGRIASLTTEGASITAEIRTLRAHLSDSDAKWKAVSAERDKNAASLEESRKTQLSQVEALDKSLQAATGERDAHSARLLDLSADLATARARLIELEPQVENWSSRFNAAVREKDVAIADWTSRWNAFDARYKHQVAALEAEIERLRPPQAKKTAVAKKAAKRIVPKDPDDLKLIHGVGPVLEKRLHRLGIREFKQIAEWTAKDIAFVESKLPGFKDRIERDDWKGSARKEYRNKYGRAL